MACNTASLHDQSDKILRATVSLRNSSDLVFADGQTFSLFSSIILLLNRSSTRNLLGLPDELIQQ